jgi:tetratricopeptide (TPR) repeat protein
MLVAAIGLLALIVGAMGIFLWKLESAGARNLRLGREAVERKDYRFAISILDDAIRQDEKQPELFRLRSRARGGVGDWVGAANDLTEAMRLGDKSDDAYRSRAAVYCILSQPELAIQDYDRLIAAHPNEADLWYSRGQQHREAGNSRNARSDLLKAGELDPDKYGKAADLFAPGQ